MEEKETGPLDLDTLIREAPERERARLEKKPKWGQPGYKSRAQRAAEAAGEDDRTSKPIAPVKSGKPKWGQPGYKPKGAAQAASNDGELTYSKPNPRWERARKRAAKAELSRSEARDRGETLARGETSNERVDEPPKKKSRYASPYAYSVMLLARREFSQAELIERLLRRGETQESAEATVKRLAELGLQDDGRFLESRVRTRKEAGYGLGRVRFDLRGHGLEEEAVETAVDDAEGWMEGAYALIERKFGVPPLSIDQQRRAIALLLRRGFTYDQAMRATKGRQE